MYSRLMITGLLLPFVSAKTSAELCRGTAQLSNDGNWYCSKVTAITYKNLNQPGTYNQTTSVNPNTGLCNHQPVSYNGVGPDTPLIGELSMHLRGPMNISQLAVYKLPDFTISKRAAAISKRAAAIVSDSEPDLQQPAQPRQTAERYPEDYPTSMKFGESVQKRWFTPETCSPRSTTTTTTTTIYVMDSMCQTSHEAGTTQTTTTTVTDTLCDKSHASSSAWSTSNLGVNTTIAEPVCTCHSTLETRISMTLSVDAPLTSPSNHPNATLGVPPITPILPVKRSNHRPVPTEATRPDATLRPISGLAGDAVAAAAASWSRVAYYTSAAPAAATGFAFLANLGDPQKSGTFDYSFGNSLSYVIGDGSKVAANSMPFDGTLETSELEMAVFTDKVCNSGDSNCGYVRPGSTAHYGFDGPSKAFLIEFQMDHYDNTGSDQGMLSDAPAWWFLNAAIPRILQYGNDRNNIPCACWSTGCGEFDAFEVLGRGEERAKSTIHRQGNLEGGDSNYFGRPVGRMLKFAVVFYNWNITARVLDDSFDFSTTLSQDQINNIIAYDPNDSSHSLFAIGK